MKKAVWLFTILLGISVPGRIVAQASSNGLVLWLKADKGIIADSKGLDSVWQDQSGNSIDAFQATAGLRPSIVKNDVNGISALRFGNGTFLNAPSRFPVGSSYTVITVISPQNLNIYNHILSGTSSRYFWFDGTAYPTIGQMGDSSATSSIAAPIDFCTVAGIANDSSKQAYIYVNGKNGGKSSYTVSNADSGINVGAFNGSFSFEGDIAEVLVYNRALNASELSAINAYLNNKYGINLPADSNISLNHFPAHLQFYQRDGHDSSLVKVDGAAIKSGYDSAGLEIFKNTARVGYFSYPLSYVNGRASFSFRPKIHAEMSEYSFRLHLIKGSTDTIAARASGIVSGDAYAIAGQSNAVALSYGSTYISEYVRSFGSLTGYSTYTPGDTAWGYANGDYYITKGISFIGGIGIQLAKNLIGQYNVPLCFINGAVGGGPIEVNLRNNADPTDLTTIYGRMLYRMQKSGIDSCAKAMIWYHGAANTITNYYPNFTTLYNSWKSDYKNLKKYYVMQIRPSTCSAGSSLALRELQRTLPDSLPDITVVSVNNAPGHNGCHFNDSGYDTIGNWVTYLFAKDFYKSTDTLNINPLNIAKAFYTDTSRMEVKITFTEKNAGISWSQDLLVNGTDYNIKNAFYLDDLYGMIKSVSVSGDTLILKLYSPRIFNTVTYIPDHYYEGTMDCYEGPWITNKRGIGAFAFYDFPVVVIPDIKANFHTGSVCLGQTYNFQDSSIVNFGSITSREWYFGDGDSSSLAKINHTYASPGNYQATLKVKSSTGLTSSITKTVNVMALPDAHFTNLLLSENTVRFSATDGSQASYKWNFGDGHGATGNPQTYQYAAQGTYTVSLTVTNASGCESLITDTIHLTFWLRAAFGFTNNTCLGAYTYFEDSSSVSSGSISKWQWDFGDSSVSKMQNPWHWYKNAGSYPVKLTVTNAYGATDSITRIVTIKPLPNANFNWTINPGRTVQFQPYDSAAGTSYNWSFGDGHTSASHDPVYVYGNDGNYTVNLEVKSGSCQQNHSAVLSIVTPVPLHSAYFSFNGTCTGTNTAFNDLSTLNADSIAAWQWDFGDGSGSSAHNPQHVYSQPGTYTVQLKILSTDGETDSATKSVIINPLPNAGFKTNIINKTMYFASEDSTLAFYIWTFGDGFGSYFWWGFHSYFNDGTYNLTLAVKDSNGCINVHSDSVQIKAAAISGIEDVVNLNSSLKIFPNPFKDHTQISLETEATAEIGIKIYDMNGNLVSVIANGYEGRGEHNYNLDAINQHLTKGEYIIKVRVGDAEVSRQVIKQ